MTQYIDKSALVAKIERLRDTAFELYGCSQFDSAYNNVLKSIDTLEVKEVDLEKEIDRVWDNTSDIFSEDGWKEFENIAKHFFELGLKAQRKSVSIQNIDEVLKELGVDPYSREAKMIEESYYAAMDKLLKQKRE